MSRAQRRAAPRRILQHWREAVPNDRLAHLVKDATRALLRALQMRLTAHDVSLGHWTFLRILWEKDGLTQRELSERSRRDGADHVLGAEGDGEARLHHAPADAGQPQEGLRLSHAERPPAEGQAGAARRGGQPRSPSTACRPEHIAATRQTLLAIIENLARDDAASADPERRIPSTRELASRVAAGGKRRS